MRFQQTKAGLKFKTEADLEDFVWVHLQQLLNMKPLKRQYVVGGEVCDILATSTSGSLVILELKNQVDRYLVQQLTRYYENVVVEKPFESEVNYSLPIQLIGIAPSFHRHNLIDQKYSRLKIEFLSFSLENKQNEIHFKLLNSISKFCTEVYLKKTDDHSPEEVDSRLARETKVHEILYHYVRVRHAHKLGLPDVSPEELAASKAKFPNKGTKLFKIRIDDPEDVDRSKFISIRVPSSIRVAEFYLWVYRNIPTATGVKSSAGPTRWIGSRTSSTETNSAEILDVEVQG